MLKGELYRSAVHLTLLLLFLSSCTPLASVPDKQPTEQRHPLIDIIISLPNQQPIAKDELINKVINADVIYLGERHDNMFHHALQLEFINLIMKKGAIPAIGFEVFSVDQTSILLSYIDMKNMSHMQTGLSSADDWLQNKLQLNSKNNKTWKYYGGLVKHAFNNDLTIFGIDLNKTLRHRITKLGISKLSAVEKLLLQPASVIDDNYRQYMHQQFKKGHCGWGETSHLDRLYDNWNARNSMMAHSLNEMAKSHNKGPVIVILGAGHTQYNRGVIDSLTRLNPELNQVNLTFTAVVDDIKQATPYQKYFVFEGVDYGYQSEYIWFTKNLPNQIDMCKAYLKKKNNKAAALHHKISKGN